MHRYMTKFNRLLFRLSCLGLPSGPHITRYVMNRRLGKYRRDRAETERCLSFANSKGLAEVLGYQRWQTDDLLYPDYNMLDIPFPDHTYDAVVSDQVLEHIEGDPFIAVKESFRVAKTGGLVLHTSCLIQPIHGCPSDFWRYTPDGLRLITEHYGRILDLGGWGNRLFMLYDAMGLRMERIPHALWHPAHWLAVCNNEQWPIVTWVLAEKTN